MSFSNVSTREQEIALVVAPAITGALSLVGSSAIVLMMAIRRRQHQTVKYRFLLGICFYDIIQSTLFLVWSLPIPEGTPGVWGAMGNQATCNFQGFMLNITSGGVFYNAALAAYYWLSVCYSMSDEEISVKYEKITHLLCLLWPMMVALVGLGMDLYGVTAIGCWMTPTPLGCHRDDEEECERGHNAYVFAWALVGAPVILLGIFLTYSMYAIYRHVQTTTQAALRYDFELQTRRSQELASPDGDHPMPSSGDSNFTESRLVSKSAATLRETGIQAFLFLLAFAAAHVFVFVCPNLEVAGGINPFWTLLLQNILYPCQGFFNVFVFLRPRINTIRAKNQELSYMQLAFRATFRYDDFQPRQPQKQDAPDSA